MSAAAQELSAYQADFELPAYVAGSIHGQQGWVVDQGRAEVAAGAGRSGSAGLVLIPSAPFSQARLSLNTGTSSADISFVDLYLRPIAGDSTAREEMIDVDSARIGLFRTETPDQAALWIFHGDGQGGGIWMATPLRLPIDVRSGLCLEWHRLSVRKDLKRQTWDLWVDEVWTSAQTGFQEPQVGGTVSSIFMGERNQSLALDSLSVAADNPLGPDKDRDGIPDSAEKKGD